MEHKKFSHVANVTDYMKIIVSAVNEFFSDDLKNRKVLDLPAGNGWVSDELAKSGAITTSADINGERLDYVQVNMEFSLPFANSEFDCVICAEGIEHIYKPEALFFELTRVLKKGGLLIITTPNVQNLYTKYQFLCTGYLYQFNPFVTRIPAQNELIDKGHISPVFYTQLRYYAETYSMKVLMPNGDRYKRITTVLLLWPFLIIGYCWAINDWKKAGKKENDREIIKHLFSKKVLFSRSLVFKAVKY